MDDGEDYPMIGISNLWCYALFQIIIFIGKNWIGVFLLAQDFLDLLISGNNFFSSVVLKVGITVTKTLLIGYSRLLVVLWRCLLYKHSCASLCEKFPLIYSWASSCGIIFLPWQGFSYYLFDMKTWTLSFW